MPDLSDAARRAVEDADEATFMAEDAPAGPDDEYAKAALAELDTPLFLWVAPKEQKPVYLNGDRVAAYFDREHMDYLCPSCGQERMPQLIEAHYHSKAHRMGFEAQYDGTSSDEREVCAVCNVGLYGWADANGKPGRP